MKYVIANLVFGFLAYMPLRFLRLFGSLIGYLAFGLPKKSSKRIKDNLLATNLASSDNVDKMARKTAMELGVTLVETICLAWFRSKKHNASLVKETKGLEYVQDALDSNKAVLFLTPHISTFEIAAKSTAAITKRMFTILYKPSKEKWFNKMMLEGRTEDNINLVPTNRLGVITLAKNLRAGGVIAILPDSVASSGDGVWIEFFGKKMFAPTLAAKMVLTPQVETFIVSVKRIKGGFSINYVPFKANDNDITNIVRSIYQEIEKSILEAPEQYYWSYNRFRVPDHAKQS